MVDSSHVRVCFFKNIYTNYLFNIFTSLSSKYFQFRLIYTLFLNVMLPIEYLHSDELLTLSCNELV